MKKIIFLALICVLLTSIAVSAIPSVWTDKGDYPPGDTVLISGSGFSPNYEQVTVSILRPDNELDVFITSTDQTGSFENFEYLLTPERAMNGAYDLCVMDDVKESCTSFTDCGSSGCDFSTYITAECSIGGKVLVKGHYYDLKRLRIEVYDTSNNLICENEMPSGTTGKDIICNTGQGQVTGYAKLYKMSYSCSCGDYWLEVKQDSISKTCEQQNVCGDGVVGGTEECDDGNSNNNDACKNDCTLNVCGDGVVYSEESPGNPTFGETGCSYRTDFTLNNAGSGENLVNFPVLIVLDSSRIDYSLTSSSDIRFYDGDGSTLLAHEIERWDEAGKSYVWVKVPQIDAGSTTDHIYAYYGCSAAATQNAAAVWDSNYIMVQHMQGAQYTALDDSTGNNNDVTAQKGLPIYNYGGIIAGAVDFSGSAQGLSVADSATLDMPANDFTIEAWINPDSVGGWDRIISKSHTLDSDPWTIYGMHFDGTSLLRVETSSGTSGSQETVNTVNSVLTDTWTYAAVKRSSNMMAVYLNGDQDNSGSWSKALGSNSVALGIAMPGGYGNNYFDGTIDEIRISDTARSSDWIKASYLTTSDSFVFYGAKETAADDGIIEGAEECDDGNTDNNDACKNDCTLNVCGDGVVYTGIELCDDGNTVSGDGCESDCTLPDNCNDFCIAGLGCGGGYICSAGNCRNPDCTAETDCLCPECGDGDIDPGEECDGTPYCGADCKCIDGYIPDPENPGYCKAVQVCGNGEVEGTEECDDGNTDNNDACRNDCTLNNCDECPEGPYLVPSCEYCPPDYDCNYVEYGCVNYGDYEACSSGYKCDEPSGPGGQTIPEFSAVDIILIVLAIILGIVVFRKYKK